MKSEEPEKSYNIYKNINFIIIRNGRYVASASKVPIVKVTGKMATIGKITSIAVTLRNPVKLNQNLSRWREEFLLILNSINGYRESNIC